MHSIRTVRRNLGFVARFLSGDLLRHVTDPRKERGRCWTPTVLLKTAFAGLIVGCKGLRELETLTKEMGSSVRSRLGIDGRVPDTTLREFLCKLKVEELVKLVEVVGYDAWRRKALHTIKGFPFGVLSMDAKYPSIRDTGEHPYLQVKHDEGGKATHGLLRVVTVTLATAVGRPILGAVPVPRETNECGAFGAVFARMCAAYGELFEMVMYDAGALSKENAETVIAAKKHYLFQMADPKWIAHQTIEMLMNGKLACARDERVLSQRKHVVRELTMLPVEPTRKNVTIWEHVKTAFKLKSETYEDGVLVRSDSRIYISSMEASRLPAKQWLELIVLRWGVETAHQILDTAFEEDDRPWITSHANGALVLMLLRRIAYTMLGLYKGVTLRSERQESVPWRSTMHSIMDAMKWPNPIEGAFRPRTFQVPPAFL